MVIVFDTSKDGMQTIMKDYREIGLRFVWEKGEEGVNSGKTWLHVNKILMEQERSISRASIIFFLNEMVEDGVLGYRERSGKGGFHRVYYPLLDEGGFKRHVSEKVISKLLETWPDEAGEIISAFQVLRRREEA